METLTARGGRLGLAALVAFGLAWCAPAEIPTEGLSYYSTFDDASKGIAAELPEADAGAWNTTSGVDPAFITVSGSRRALDLATYRNWSSGSGQTVLAAEGEAFTIAFTARPGSTAKGLLFAFGGKADGGGLSFRRGDAPGSLSVCTGENVERIAYVPENGADVTYRHYALVGDASGLRLYVDGTALGEGPTEPSGLVIAPKFQWAKRHGGELTGEAIGNGAIDVLGVWARALTAEEIAALAAEMAPPFASVTFDVPAGWASKPVPTQAVQRSLTANLALEQDAAFRQTLGGRGANVAEITGSDATRRNLFGVNDSGHGNKDTALARDVWLKVSGGAHDVVVGGSDNYWKNNQATPLNGDIFVELTGAGTSANTLVGAAYSGGYGVGVNGNVMVVVADGAKVSGNIVGSMYSTHNQVPVLTGNSTVRILTLQEGGSRILGGSAYMGNSASGAKITGNTAVQVALPETASGEFAKEIVGGSYAKTASYAITGSTSVAVTAPDAVSFTQPIYGASVSDSSEATVSGDSSVTLDGGTYPNVVYAAGYGANGGVAGKATLTLKGGVFTGTLGVGRHGATAGSAELVVAGGETIDLSRATVADGFTALTLKGNLNLGANRLPGAALTVEGERTLTLAATAAEVADRRVTLGRAEAVPEGLTVEATGLPEGEAWTLTAAAGELRYVPAKTSHTWQAPAEGSAWADGLPGFRPGDDVTFAANGAQETVTLPGARVGAITVAGVYTFEGTGLTADRVTVAEEAALTFAGNRQVAAYLRLTPSEAKGAGNNVYPGVAELILTRGGEPVAWPTGTTVRQVNADGTVVDPVWDASGNEKPNALIDGVYGGTTQTYTNPYDGTTGTYSASQNNNKWWPLNAAGASAVVALGAPVDFDGYVVWNTDYVPRSPRAWTLEVSMDGNTWFLADRRTFAETEIPAANAAYNGGEPFGVLPPQLVVAEGMEVAGTLGGAGTVSGDVAFAEGSVLKVPAEGTLTVDGALSGAATLDVSAWGGLTDTTVRSVLCAPEGLSLTPPEGYAVHYADGCYWLARALTQPFTATLSGDADWLEADWQDAQGVPVAPAQWDVLPIAEQTAKATAGTEGATLTLGAARSVNSLTVTASEHTLTLAGAKLTPNALTVEGMLAAASATLALPAGTAVAGTLTYDVSSGSVAMPAMTGEGTFVKTGAGTLTLASGTAVAPTVVVRDGTLALPSGESYGTVYAALPNIVAEVEAIVDLTSAMGSIADSNATITLRNGGIFRFSNGNSWSSRPIACAFHVENDGETFASFRGSYYGSAAKFTGGISGHGLAVFEQGQSNPYTIACAISDDSEGALRVRFADENSIITVSGANTYTGGTEIASAVTAQNADAFGTGPLSIASGKTLTVASGTTLNVRGALSGEGTVSGAICLAEGASLDAAAGLLTVGNVTVAAGATIPVTLPTDVVSGAQLLAWTEGPATMAFVAEGLKPTARLAARADGLYYEEVAFGAVGSDAAAIDALSPEAQRTLAEAAFAADAVTVAAVSGTTAGRPLTAEEIDGALVCFEGALTAEAEDGSATLTVAYDFGIAAMSYDPAVDVLSVTARVQGPEGTAGVTFVPGVTLEVYVPLADGLGEQSLCSVLVEETGLSEKTVGVALSAQRDRFAVRPAPIKVRVRK